MVMPLAPLDQLPRAAETLTVADAYRAMLGVLKYYASMTNDYEVGSMLGDLDTNAGVWTDGLPGDPEAWSLWLKAIDARNRSQDAGA